jgi:hypothetical protein
MAIVCEGYPDILISKDKIVAIQKAIGRLMDGLPEEGFTPGWWTPTGPTGQRAPCARIRKPVKGWPGCCLP